MHAILYGMRGVVDFPDKTAPHALSRKLDHAISHITSDLLSVSFLANYKQQ